MSAVVAQLNSQGSIAFQMVFLSFTDDEIFLRKRFRSLKEKTK